MASLPEPINELLAALNTLPGIGPRSAERLALHLVHVPDTCVATDNGADLTAQYTGYTFVLYKSTYYNGPMTAVKNGVTYNGTWSSNDDYSKLVITFPSTPAEFVFLNREWKFTKKSLPIMELAPWGTLEPKVLHMEQF